MRKIPFVALLTALGIGALSAPAYGIPDPLPIPQGPGANAVQKFFGHPADPHRIATRPIPDNPFMSPGSWSNIHDDTYMSDTYFTPAARGLRPVVSST